MNDKQRQPLEWNVVKDFTDTDSGLTVRISRADGFRPRFSVQVGKLLLQTGADSRFIRYLNVFTRAEDGVVKIGPELLILAVLLQQAHNYIHDQAQAREDEIIQAKIDREKKQLDRDKPIQKPGLKALARRDAEKRGGG